MKLRNTLILCSVYLVLSLGVAQAQPLARISIKSFGELSNALVRVVGAVDPEQSKELGGQLSAGLGLTNTALLDLKAPWELAVWTPGEAGAPLIALKGKIADVKKFRSELQPEGMLAKDAKDWVQLENGLAAIVFTPADKQTDAEKLELKRWEAEPLVPPRRTLEVALTPSDAARAQVLPFLGMARMSMSQMAAAVPGGANPKAMGDMFNLYFDGIEAFVKGCQDFKLAVALTPDSLLLEQTVSAKAGSALAKWIAKPANPVTAEDLTALNADALLSASITLSKDAPLMDLARKFLRVSMEMQNQGTNDSSVNDLMQMMEKSLPARVSGSVFLKEALEFAGMYRFPQSDPAKVYAEMKPLMTRFAKTQSGEGKMYSSASFTEKHHSVGAVPVDRYSFTLNLDNPMFQMPGQKEQLEALWPKGKLEFDYAVNNGKLLFASPERMAGLIEVSAKSGNAPAITPNDSTVAAGYLNLLGFIARMSGANPMIPDAIKERLAKLDTKDTGIWFQLEMNNQVRFEQQVPLKLLQQLGGLKD